MLHPAAATAATWAPPPQPLTLTAGVPQPGSQQPFSAQPCLRFGIPAGAKPYLQAPPLRAAPPALLFLALEPRSPDMLLPRTLAPDAPVLPDSMPPVPQTPSQPFPEVLDPSTPRPAAPSVPDGMPAVPQTPTVPPQGLLTPRAAPRRAARCAGAAADAAQNALGATPGAQAQEGRAVPRAASAD